MWQLYPLSYLYTGTCWCVRRWRRRPHGPSWRSSYPQWSQSDRERWSYWSPESEVYPPVPVERSPRPGTAGEVLGINIGTGQFVHVSLLFCQIQKTAQALFLYLCLWFIISNSYFCCDQQTSVKRKKNRVFLCPVLISVFVQAWRPFGGQQIRMFLQLLERWKKACRLR